MTAERIDSASELERQLLAEVARLRGKGDRLAKLEALAQRAQMTSLSSNPADYIALVGELAELAA